MGPGSPPLLCRIAAWGLTGTLACAILSLTTDIPLLGSFHAPVRTLLAGGVAGLSLGLLLSLGAAPMAVLLCRLSRDLLLLPPPWCRLFPLPVAATAGMAALIATSSPEPPPPLLRVALVSACVLSMGAITHLSQWRRRDLADAAAVALALFALALDVDMSRSLYREVHDLLGVISLTGILLLLSPVRWRIVRVAPPILATVCLGAVALSLTALYWVDDLAPGWRMAFTQQARLGPRLARAARALIDLDGDGFSPVAWGGDCDDLDAAKNPMSLERPGGGDANCNGASLPEVPGPADHGLSPATGSPDLVPDAVDLVVLLTVDCMRAEAFQPEVMPRMWALSRQGLRLERMYAAATSTRIATRVMQRGPGDAPPLSRRLQAAGVSSTAVIGLGNELFDGPTDGFSEVLHPPPGVEASWDAEEVTRQGLASLRSGRAGRRYLWLHYFDAHVPYRTQRGLNIPPPLPRLAASYGQYLAELTFIDAAIGTLLDGLRRDGRMGKTLLLFTGDHGEGFGEHEVMYHHVSGYEAVTHIPGVLVAPGLSPGQYGGLVTQLDLPATVLGGLALSAGNADVEEFGRSWLRLLRTPAVPLHRFVAIRTGRAVSGERSLSPMFVIVDGRYKLIRSLEDDLVELYDVLEDPDELHNLTAERPSKVSEIRIEGAIYRDLDRWPRAVLHSE